LTLSNKAINESSNSKFSLVLPVIGIGFVFIALNLQLFFDLVILPGFLLELYKNNIVIIPVFGIVLNSESLTLFSANIIRAVYLLVFMVVIIIAGTYSDHLQTRFGSRIPLILFGLFLIMLSYIIGSITVPFIKPYYISFSILYILIAIGAGCVWAPAYALVVDLFNPEERHWVGLGIALMGSIGPLIGIGLTNSELNLLGFLTSLLVLDSNFPFFMVIFGIVIIFFGLIAITIIPKKNLTEVPKSSIRSDILNTRKYMFHRNPIDSNQDIKAVQLEIRGKHTLLILLVYQIFSGAAIFVILTNVPILLLLLNESSRSTINVGMTRDVAFILMGLFGAILAVPSGFLIKFLGKTRAAMVGAFAFGIASLLLAQEFMWTFNGFLIILILFGGSSVIIGTLTIALPADHVPSLKAGQFMGMFIIASSLASPAMGIISSLITLIVRDELLSLKLLFFVVTFIEILVIILLANLHSREKEIEVLTSLEPETETSQSTHGTS